MQAGASTACFYPLETERALQQVTELGFPFAEVFFNARQELRPAFVRQLAAIAGDGGTQVVSVHPFSSFMESSCIFGDYQRRFEDTIDIYKETCHAAALLGAQFVVIHGAVAQPKIPIPEERYFARFLQLVEIGRAEGVTVCQENVNRFKSQHIAFCDRMRRALGDDFHMVLDIKQAVRAGEDPFVFLDTFQKEIVHVHISDHSPEKDCQPPGQGSFDFQRLYRTLGDRVHYMIEIYSRGCRVAAELQRAKAYLDTIK